MPLNPSSSRGGGGSGAGGVLLGSATLASNAATISVSGIAGGHAMLMVVIQQLQSSVAAVSDVMTITFNNDSGASHYGGGNSNSSIGVQMGGFTTSIKAPVPGTSAGINQAGGVIMWIPNYTNTSNQIAFTGLQYGRIATGGTTGDFPAAYFSGIWNGGAAVSSLQVGLVTGPNILAGCQMFVLGIN